MFPVPVLHTLFYLQVSRFSIALYVLGNIPITKEMLRIKHSINIAYFDILKWLVCVEYITKYI